MDWYKLFKIFIFSAVPLTEQRATIPYGLYLHLNPMAVMVAAFLGSLIPVPFVLLFFNGIFKWMKKYKIFEPINKFIENKLQKNTGKLEKYKELGLITFVAIPLPTTGLWTGSAVAAFLGLDFKKSFICTALGGILSAIIITLICLAFPGIFKLVNL